MGIPDHMIQEIRDNPFNGALALCRWVRDEVNKQSSDWTEYEHEILIEATAIILHLQESGLLKLTTAEPAIDGSMTWVCSMLSQYVDSVEDELNSAVSGLKLKNFKKAIAVTLSNGFAYEFTDGDLKRIQHVINELRAMIAANTELDDGHRQRLLKRLEKMQSELHKRMSDISRFYELMGDAGVALGKLGEGAKPIVEAIKELAGIAWKSQARAEQLQTDAENPLIGQDGGPKLLE